MPDKYSAVWVSHSSIADFLRCPRAYYLKNVYKDPNTNHKIQLITPALSLGAAVHEVIESLSTIPTEKRFNDSLLDKFTKTWERFSGKRGGFYDQKTEDRFKKEGEDMLRKVIQNPGPLNKLAVKIKQELPQYWLSEEDNIILCGKIDWLEYFPDSDSVKILDFKTSKKRESNDSLQLPIYYLLASNTQNRKVIGVSYWYLRLETEPSEVELPDLQASHEQVLKIAKEIKLARQLNRFRCPSGEKGCSACKPMERILRGEAEFVGENEYRQDVYALPLNTNQTEESVIL